MEDTTRTIACKKCTTSFRIDFSKAPHDVFTVACPKCGQKYQLSKPTGRPATHVPVSEPVATVVPSRPSPSGPGPSPTATPIGIDLSRFNPRNSWQYNLYRYTAAVPYAKNVTLPIYGAQLVNSIASIARHQAATGSITPAAYSAMKANMSATCSAIYSAAIAPELSDLGIPRFMQKPFAARFTKSLAEELTSSLVLANTSNPSDTHSVHASPSHDVMPQPSTTKQPTAEQLAQIPRSASTATQNAPRKAHPELRGSLQSVSIDPHTRPTQMFPPHHTTTRAVPTAMWVVGVLLLLCCFLPWIQFPGRSALGFQNATHFWQGKVAIVLIVIALLAKQFRKHGISGISALVIPALAIHLWLKTAEVLRGIEPHFGAISLFILAIPFTVIAFYRRGVTPSPLPSLVNAPPPPPPPPPPGTTPITTRSEHKPTPKPKRALAPFLIGGVAAILLGLSAWWLIDLRHRHTLTTAERAKIEGWFKPIVSKQDWVVIQTAQDELPELSFNAYKPQVLSVDGYGNVSIELAVALPPYAYDTGPGRFETMITTRYDSLNEPQRIHLCNEEPEGQGRQCFTWTIVSPDSMTIEFDDKEFWPGTYSVISYGKFEAHKATHLRNRSAALVRTVDDIAQGVGLLRRGSFRSYGCGDECGATFLEIRNGQPTPITYLCNNNRFGEVQLSHGDMIGEGDFTNQQWVGSEFLIVSKQVNLNDVSSAWVIMGLLPFSQEQMSPELQQRLAVTANFDAAADGTKNPSVAAFASTVPVLSVKEVEQPPSFPGGEEALFDFLKRSVHYPVEEQDAGIQGIVYL
nr:hypothetical protein [Flavobacteriales bacterium]